MNTYAHQKWHGIIAFFGSSFVLHFVWEMLHAPLYRNFVTSFWQHFKACLFATATGDMLFILIIYLMLATVHRDLWWPTNKANYQHLATWIVPIVLGVLLATSYELWAVYVQRRWTYGSMPLIPVVDVGVTPVLQMIAIPLLSIYFSSRYSS